jgi:hypothetical protein
MVLRGVRRLLCGHGPGQGQGQSNAGGRPDYRAAFLQLRTHRIDLNLLYDHDPAQFLAHARDFVEQVANVDYINLFLSSVRSQQCDLFY